MRSADSARPSAFVPPTKQLFADFLARVEIGESIEFDRFCAEHAEHALELRRLHAMWLEISSVFSAPRSSHSLSQRLTQRFGSGVDPAISLERDVERLAQRGAAHGRYRIVDEVGRGGMGAVMRVWDEDLRRTLAMKLLLDDRRARGDDTRSLGRFLEEAQVMGQLDHPGVVPVHELGLDASGRVYFTMKLVQGRTFGDVIAHVHAQRDGWTLTRALGVLHKVCETMAYAHERGVIHRDLKPSNVMVGDFGAVYVMDWGLAHVVGHAERKDVRIRDEQSASDANAALLTMDGDVLGTPAYMSPQQALGKTSEVGPRWDVYSLGAMLYHLLTGHMPYVERDQSRSARQVLALLSLGAPKPVHELAPQVPDELASICAKAMARDPAQRYSRVQELADDLQAWLEGRVVRAHASGAIIELRKWVQRNTAFASALAAAALILVMGFIGTRTQYVRAEGKATEALDNLAEARRQTALANDHAARVTAEKKNADEQRVLADKRADETRQVAGFQSQMLANLAPAEFGRVIRLELREEVKTAHERVGHDTQRTQQALQAFDDALSPANVTTVARRVIESKLMRPAIDAVNEKFANLPLVEATLLTSVVETARRLGLFDFGVEAGEKATAIRRSALGDTDPITLDSIANLAVMLRLQGRLIEAETLAREALDGNRCEFGDDHQNTLSSINNLALLLKERGNLIEAETLAREALEGNRRVRGDEDPETLTSINNLAGVLMELGRFGDAEPLAREALAGSRLRRGDGHPETLNLIGNLVTVLATRGQLDEAEPLAREALDGSRRDLGDDHPGTLTSINNFAVLLMNEGQPYEAEPLLREVLEVRRAKLGDDHPDTLTSLNNMAFVLEARGNLSDAELLYREGLESCRRKLGDDHLNTLVALNNLAFLLKEQDKLGESETLYRECLERSRRKLSNDHLNTLIAMGNLAEPLRLQGKLDEAERLLREALEGCRRVLGGDNLDTLTAINNLAFLLKERGKLTEAEPLYRECLEGSRSVLGDDNPDTLDSINTLGLLLQEQGKPDEAEPLLREGLERRRRKLGDEDSATLHSIRNLGKCLTELRRFAEAEPLLIEAESVLRNAHDRPAKSYSDTLQALARLYDSWNTTEPDRGHDAQATHWRDELDRLRAAK